MLFSTLYPSKYARKLSIIGLLTVHFLNAASQNEIKKKNDKDTELQENPKTESSLSNGKNKSSHT